MALKSSAKRKLAAAVFALVACALVMVPLWLTCTGDTAPPATPSRLQKTTPGTDNTPTFTWAASIDNDSGIASYLIRMDREAWTRVGDVTTYTCDTPLSDGNHTFEIRAVDNRGNESGTTSLQFLCDATPPPCPAQKSPAEGQCTNDATPAFDWGNASDPSGVTYRLQIDDDADFSSLWLSWQWLGDSEYTLDESEALVDGKYYWRVCAVDAVGHESEWSPGRSFTVDTVPPPLPLLEYPADGKSTADNTPWLNWSDVTDATSVHYHLQVDNNSDFSSPEVNSTWINPSSANVPVALPDDLYYWRVRSVDAAGSTSAWTASRTLTIDAP